MSPRCSSKSTKNTGIDSYLFYFCNMKALYILFGTLSLILGIIGIFLPLLPTTPFLLLTAALYVRSSPRLIWITILNCVFFIAPYWWLKILLLLIAAGTSYHILSFKTLK